MPSLLTSRRIKLDFLNLASISITKNPGFLRREMNHIDAKK